MRIYISKYLSEGLWECLNESHGKERMTSRMPQTRPIHGVKPAVASINPSTRISVGGGDG